MSISKTVEDVDIIKRETVFDEYFQMVRYHLKHRKHDGGWSETLSREIFQRGAVTGVLPYDAKRDRLVLIEQFRAGALAAIEDDNIFLVATSSPWLVEIVAGVVEESEDLEDVARREMEEEAGCKALDLQHIYTYHASPGAINEPVAVFCAEVDSDNVAGIQGLDEEGEDIRVFTASPDEAAKMLSEGRILNSMTIIALQWFAANHDKLRERWG